MRLLAFAFTIVFVWTGPKFEPCVNVCFTVRIFSVAGTERIFNFLKRYEQVKSVT